MSTDLIFQLDFMLLILQLITNTVFYSPPGPQFFLDLVPRFFKLAANRTLTKAKFSSNIRDEFTVLKLQELKIKTDTQVLTHDISKQ